MAAPGNFKALAETLKHHKPRLAAACENVVCVSYAPPLVVVRVPKGNEVFGDILREKDTPALLNELFGTALALEIDTTQSAALDTLAEARRSERQAEVRGLKHEGSVHPAVKKVIDALGGQIRGVQVRAALTHPVDDYE
jgi:hypothetical protein